MAKPLIAQSVLLLSTVAAIANPKAYCDPEPLQTSSGLVQGHRASWPDNSSVIEYLGIPYAQPPLGQLRFAAPQAYAPSNLALFAADKYYTGGGFQNVSAEVAAYGYGMGGGSASEPHSYSEDCLTLNVWTRPSVRPNASRAVLLWIYGGAFVTGTSHAPFYDGARLAQDEDVVVVSFNYRVNIFGFPQAPGLADQNLGLLDQRLAVEWVRDNIAAFGGDPFRITLFGESAGGSSVDFYSYAWMDDPIVNGFIAESGTAFILDTPSLNYTGWYNISETLGCGGAEAGEETVQCLRGKNATDIITTVGTGNFSTTFTPVADDKVVFADVRNRSEAGQFIKKPYFVGNNDNELGLIRAIGSQFLGGSNFPPNISLDEIITIGSALEFDCPAALAAKDRAANGVPTWRYRYMGVWNNTALLPGIGAYHSSEIPFVFGTNGLRPNSTPDTPDEAKLSRNMMHAWADFAKDPTNGLTQLGWPSYNPNATSLIRLGYNNQSAPTFAKGTEYDGLCSTLGYNIS